MTSPAGMDVSSAQPTTLRLHTSSTMARYKGPPRVGICVKSATQSWLGPLAWNPRLTKSGAGRARLSRRVVRHFFRRVTPDNPAPRINRATRFRLTR